MSYFDFRYWISNLGYRAPSLYLYPEHQNIGYFNDVFQSLEKMNNLIKTIEDVISHHKPIIFSGGQESYFLVQDTGIEFVVTLPGHDEKLILDTKIFLNILLEYKAWLLQIESCQIPGIIPESKLDSWACVPNEYIKEEWWEQQKSKDKND